jgi:hypothetical protein
MSHILSKQLVGLFLTLVLLFAVFSPCIQADSDASSKVTKRGGKRNRNRRTGTELLAEVMDIIADFGGDAVAGAIDEFTMNLEQTSKLLESLAHDDTIDSVNFFTRNALLSFGVAARDLLKRNNGSDIMQPSDFGEYLELFQSTLITRCKEKANFPRVMLQQIEIALPPVLQALTELYRNIVDASGFGLTFNMLSTGTSFLSMLERPEYVSRDTFQQFANFPAEIKQQFETVLDDVVSQYVDPTQLDMMLNAAKMFAQNFARRGEHDDL